MQAYTGRPLTLKKFLKRLLGILAAGMVFLYLLPAAVSVFLLRQGISREQHDRAAFLVMHGGEYLKEMELGLVYTASLVDKPGPEDGSLLEMFMKHYPWFHNLYLTDTGGIILCDAGTEYPLVRMDVSQDPLFVRVKALGYPALSLTSLSLTSRKTVVSMAVPVRSGGDINGILFGELDLSLMQQQIVKVTSESGGTALIVDQRGTLVAHPDSGWVQQQPNLGNDPFVVMGKSAPDRMGVFPSTALGPRTDRQYLIGSSRLMDNGWQIITVDPLFKVIRPLLVQMTISLMVLFLLFLLMTLLSVRYARKLVLPLDLLVRKVNTVRSGEYRMERMPETGIIEIDQLALNFVNMTDAIRERDRFLEEKVRDRTAELIASREKEAVANRAKSVFLANVSHELRTPLNAILGFSQVLWAAPNLSDSQRENLGVVVKNGERLLRLINDVIELGRLETRHAVVKYGPVNIRDLVQGICDLLRGRAADKGLSLVPEFDANLPDWLESDSEKLQQILINLTDNAIKYTDRGGVVIRCRYEGQLLASVSDSGSGIPAGERERIFEIFYKGNGKNDQGSSGLGLPIVRQTVLLMGGDLSVGDSDTGGSCFHVRIPAHVSFRPDHPDRLSLHEKPDNTTRPEDLTVSVARQEFLSLFSEDPENLDRFSRYLRLGDAGGVVSVFRAAGRDIPPWLTVMLDDFRFDELLALMDGGKGVDHHE
jgi:signal transduction histidine kinase